MNNINYDYFLFLLFLVITFLALGVLHPGVNDFFITVLYVFTLLPTPRAKWHLPGWFKYVRILITLGIIVYVEIIFY